MQSPFMRVIDFFSNIFASCINRETTLAEMCILFNKSIYLTVNESVVDNSITLKTISNINQGQKMSCQNTNVYSWIILW